MLAGAGALVKAHGIALIMAIGGNGSPAGRGSASTCSAWAASLRLHEKSISLALRFHRQPASRSRGRNATGTLAKLSNTPWPRRVKKGDDHN